MKRVFVIIALATGPIFADEVYLRGGGQITGEIVEQSDDAVTVDIGGGTITTRMSNVVRIEKGISPLQEYRVKAESVPDNDAEGWRELARWARGNALTSQSQEAYSQVVAIVPDDEEANHALGLVRLDGDWVTEDENYLAQGYVEFEGQWMTPGEQKSILADRQARELADRQSNEARIATLDAEIKADKQRKADEMEESRRRNAVSLGWGYGPGYWPQPRGGVWR